MKYLTFEIMVQCSECLRHIPYNKSTNIYTNIPCLGFPVAQILHILLGLSVSWDNKEETINMTINVN